MAARLLQGFALAQREQGVEGRLKLALRLGLSQVRAAREQDSSERVAQMEHALNQILGHEVKL